MSHSRVVYKISEIPGFNKLLRETEAEAEAETEKGYSNTLKLCKTNIVTRNNKKYKIIRYDKNFLSVDLIPQTGLLRSVIVNENNNRLDININGVNSSYFFDYGNYNATYFISKFVTLLGSQWNITLNSNNSIFTITNSTNNFTLLASSTISQIMCFNTNLTH